MTAATDRLGIFDVARDLVELGRVAEAVRLLDEQAPDRLDNECPACGAVGRHMRWNDSATGMPCHERGVVPCRFCTSTGKRIAYYAEEFAKREVVCEECRGRGRREQLVDMIVPHDSRALGVRRAW